jgi:hypothetical protein
MRQAKTKYKQKAIILKNFKFMYNELEDSNTKIIINLWAFDDVLNSKLNFLLQNGSLLFSGGN